MKKQIHNSLGLATLIIIAFTTCNAVGQEATTPKIPTWAQKEINKVAEAAPSVTDEQKVKIFKAIEARGKAIKAVKESSAAADELKVKSKAVWSIYINTMKEILSAEQFTQFDENRLKKGKKTSDE